MPATTLISFLFPDGDPHPYSKGSHMEIFSNKIWHAYACIYTVLSKYAIAIQVKKKKEKQRTIHVLYIALVSYFVSKARGIGLRG